MTARILVVDDDYDMVEILCQYLEIKGFEVIGRGYNGEEAVTLYEDLRPDVVFLDVMMPRYDGFYALQKIRMSDSDALVIMVTADVRPETYDKLRYLDASAVISKSLDFDRITSIVENLITDKQCI